MQYGRLAIAAAAATAVHAASGDLALTDSTYAGITVGENFEITWAGAEGPVTLVLVDDANPLNVIPVETIASGQTGTAFNWVPQPTLVNLADYAIKIMDSVTSNYGAQFQLIGGATASATASSTASASATDVTTTTTPTTAPATTTTAPSTTVATSTTQFSNTTMTTKTHSKTASSTGSSTASASASQTSAPSAANTLASPLALIFLTVAALFSLN